MNLFQSLVQAATKAVKTLNWDVPGLIGSAGLVYGVALISEAAAWIVAGLLLMAISLWGGRVWHGPDHSGD